MIELNGIQLDKTSAVPLYEQLRKALLEAISAFPHLRPCPKANWWWLDKKRCQKCRNRVEVKLEGREENGRTENAYAR